MNGQMSVFDILPKKQINEKNKCLGDPCMYCDVEWCSLQCFIRRGYLWDRAHGFARDSHGNVLKRSAGYRECTKVF